MVLVFLLNYIRIVYEIVYHYRYLKMSKAGGKMKALKKAVEKVNHSNLIRTNIPAGMAVAGPPLGPMLGQVCCFCQVSNIHGGFLKGFGVFCDISLS